MRNLDHQEKTELANLFKYETFSGMDYVMNIGDQGDKFFIIIQGVVSVQIHNLTIPQRMFKRREYDKLLQWKRDEFDPKVEIAKKEK